MTEPLAMNPFVDIHVHPAPDRYPIEIAHIATITVRCPVRGRGLVIHDLTRTRDPELFAFFGGLVARNGELELDSDAPLIDELARIGFLVREDDVVEWPQLRAPLDQAPADTPLPDATWRVAETFVFQPAFALHPGARWPADYEEQDGRLRCFDASPAFWLGDPARRVDPYWVTDEQAGALATLVPGAPPPALAPALARALVHAGALCPAPVAPADRLAPHRAAFAATGHAIVRDLLRPGELAAVRRYYAALLAADLVPFGDRQNARRFSSYNDPVGRFVHARLAGAMAAVAGQPVRPSFSYFFAYLEGAALAPHKDRAQAELSISLQIDHAPAPAAGTGWPLCFTFDDGGTAEADLAIGDAVLYHGRAVTHARGPLAAGHRSSVLVLEYVPIDFAGLLI